MNNFDFYIRNSYIGKVIEYGDFTVELVTGTIDMKYAKVIKSGDIVIRYEFGSAIIDFVNKTITIGEFNNGK